MANWIWCANTPRPPAPPHPGPVPAVSWRGSQLPNLWSRKGHFSEPLSSGPRSAFLDTAATGGVKDMDRQKAPPIGSSGESDGLARQGHQQLSLFNAHHVADSVRVSRVAETPNRYAISTILICESLLCGE